MPLTTNIPRPETFSSGDSIVPLPLLQVENVLGLRFHCLTTPECLRLIDTYIQERRPHQITLANAYTVALCQKNPELQNLLNHSDLTLADGMSIVWGSRWLGSKIPCRVAGPDLMEALCDQSAKKGYRIFLMGTSPENLETLKTKLLQRCPALIIAGTHSPSMCDRLDEMETLMILKEIHEARPDILFVGMSAPKQELWIAENKHRLEVPVALGMGAAFDFLSGRIPRAPERMRSLGLEWLYRLGCEPRRLWKRYLLGNAIFLSLLIKEALVQKLSFRKSTTH